MTFFFSIQRDLKWYLTFENGLSLTNSRCFRLCSIQRDRYPLWWMGVCWFTPVSITEVTTNNYQVSISINYHSSTNYNYLYNPTVLRVHRKFMVCLKVHQPTHVFFCSEVRPTATSGTWASQLPRFSGENGWRCDEFPNWKHKLLVFFRFSISFSLENNHQPWFLNLFFW